MSDTTFKEISICSPFRFGDKTFIKLPNFKREVNGTLRLTNAINTSTNVFRSFANGQTVQTYM